MEDRKRLDIEALVRKIVEEIKGTYGAQHQVLLIMEDDKTAFADIVGQLELLKAQSLSLVVLTTGNMKDYLETFNLFDAVYQDVHKDEIRKLLEQSAILAAPLINLSTIAKVSMGIGDNSMEVAIGKAIGMGRRVLVSIDGCLPEDISHEPSAAYIDMIVFHLKKIVSYGCKLTHAPGFAKTLLAELQGMQGVNKDRDNFYLDKPSVTAEDILLHQNANRIVISADSCLTETAQQTAMKHKIEIFRKLV